MMNWGPHKKKCTVLKKSNDHIQPIRLIRTCQGLVLCLFVVFYCECWLAGISQLAAFITYLAILIVSLISRPIKDRNFCQRSQQTMIFLSHDQRGPKFCLSHFESVILCGCKPADLKSSAIRCLSMLTVPSPARNLLDQPIQNTITLFLAAQLIWYYMEQGIKWQNMGPRHCPGASVTMVLCVVQTMTQEGTWPNYQTSVEHNTLREGWTDSTKDRDRGRKYTKH